MTDSRYNPPKTTRFFDQSSLPDLKNYVHIQSGRQVSLNNQSSSVNYNPYTYPQQKTKSNLPVDFFHLQNKITVVENQPSGDDDKLIPTFELSHEQFANPIKFIESVSEIGKKYGAIKVIPPTAPVIPTSTSNGNIPNHANGVSDSNGSGIPVGPNPPTAAANTATSTTPVTSSEIIENSFKSNFQINADLFWFQTNRLLNNPNGDELNNRLRFHKELIKFHLDNAKVEEKPPGSLSPSPIPTKSQVKTEVSEMPQSIQPVGAEEKISDSLTAPALTPASNGNELVDNQIDSSVPSFKQESGSSPKDANLLEPSGQPSNANLDPVHADTQSAAPFENESSKSTLSEPSLHQVKDLTSLHLPDTPSSSLEGKERTESALTVPMEVDETGKEAAKGSNVNVVAGSILSSKREPTTFEAPSQAFESTTLPTASSLSTTDSIEQSTTTPTLAASSDSGVPENDMLTDQNGTNTPASIKSESDSSSNNSSDLKKLAAVTNGIDAAKSKKNQLPSFLNKLPMIDKRPLDLYKLFRSVLTRGGFIEVINKKLWAQIGRELGYRGKIMTSLSSSLKSSYMKILYPFEVYLAKRRSDIRGKRTISTLDGVEAPASKKPRYDNFLDGLSTPLIIGSPKTFKRSVRLKADKGFLLNSPHLTDVKQPNTVVSKKLSGASDALPSENPQNLASPVSSQANNKRKKSKPNSNLPADQSNCVPITPSSQLNKSLKSLLENPNVQDSSQITSNGKFSSVYTLRQFMEKDLKFQEFLIQMNEYSFSRLHYANGLSTNNYSSSTTSNLPSASIPLTNQNSPASNGPQARFSYFNTRESSADKFPTNPLTTEKNVIQIDKLESLYWKFVSNDPDSGTIEGEEAYVLDLIRDGLELENGVNLPSFINGSGFVRLGDDLSNYKNILANVAPSNQVTNSIPTSSGSSPTQASQNATGSFAPSNQTGKIATSLGSMPSAIISSSVPTTASSSATSSFSSPASFDGAYYNSSEYSAKMIKSSLSPWNLHNLPVLPNSLFGVLGEHDVNNRDLFTPTLNIGMTFSTENWHVEDHFTQLCNYQFFGGHKKWYFIPESEFEKFENLIAEKSSVEDRIHMNNENWNYDALLNNFASDESGSSSCNNIEGEALLSSLENMIPPYSDYNNTRLQNVNEKFQKLVNYQREKRKGQNQNGTSTKSLILSLNQDCFMSPSILDQAGIRYSYAIQRPGEFIIKFPKTYSSTISFGLNLSEEVNFATSNWLNYAIEGEKWINKQLLLPNFSTFKVLINLAQLHESNKYSIYFDQDVYHKASQIYETLYTKEMELRDKVRGLVKNVKEVVEEKSFIENSSISDDDLQNAFPSKVVLFDASGFKDSMIISLENFVEYKESNFPPFDAASNSDIKIEMHLYCSDEKLKHYYRVLSTYSVDYRGWVQKYEESMKEDALLPLKALKTLLSDGEKIYSAASAALFTKSGENENDPDYLKFKRHLYNLREFVKFANEFVEECQVVLSVKHQQRIRGGRRIAATSISTTTTQYEESDSLINDTTILQKLIQLLDKIPTLNFYCPEAEQILELQTEIENFERASRNFLDTGNSSTNSIREFDDLISLGESFGIGLPSLRFLTRLRDRIIWIEHYEILVSGGDPINKNRRSNSTFSIADLQKFYERGAEILGEEDQAKYKEINQIILKSEVFNDEVGKFLSYDTIDLISLDRLENLSVEYETEPLYLDSKYHEQLMKIKSNLPLIEKFIKFKQQISITDSSNEVRKSYKVQEANSLHTSIAESGLKFNKDIILNQIRESESWVEEFSNKLKERVYSTTIQIKDQEAKSSSKSARINAIIEDYSIKNSFNFAGPEQDKYELSSSYTFLKEQQIESGEQQAQHLQEGSEDGDDIQPIYCICREFEAGTMIECDVCNEWYHIQCLQEYEESDELPDNYSCPFCVLVSKGDELVDANLQEKVSLRDLKTLLSKGEKLVVIPGEISILREFVTECDEAVNNFGIELSELKSDSNLQVKFKIDRVRFLSRKIYGASIYLDELSEQFIQYLRLLLKESEEQKSSSNGKTDSVNEKGFESATSGLENNTAAETGTSPRLDIINHVEVSGLNKAESQVLPETATTLTTIPESALKNEYPSANISTTITPPFSETTVGQISNIMELDTNKLTSEIPQDPKEDNVNSNGREAEIQNVNKIDIKREASEEKAVSNGLNDCSNSLTVSENSYQDLPKVTSNGHFESKLETPSIKNLEAPLSSVQAPLSGQGEITPSSNI